MSGVLEILEEYFGVEGESLDITILNMITKRNLKIKDLEMQVFYLTEERQKLREENERLKSEKSQ